MSESASTPTGHSDNPWCSSKTAPHRRRKHEKSDSVVFLWDMWQSVHWTDWLDTQLKAERTQKNPDIRKPSTISYSKACHEKDTCDRLEGGTGLRQSSTLRITMHIGGRAHQVREEQFK